MCADYLAKGTLVGLLLFGLGGLAQQPAEHPGLKLAEDGTGIDYGACRACHADKATGSVVHAALELRCESCHEVEQEEGETEVFLVTEGNDLCYTCHSDKQPQPAQLSVHAPVRRQRCTVCHDAHASENEALLQQGVESREPAENLCLSCHTDIVTQLQQPTEHAAIDLGCSTCHLTHKSEPEDAPEGVFHLLQAPPELCLNCHDVEDNLLGEAHAGQPFAGSRCTACHNPHGSQAPKLVNNYVHGAFEMGCETCHEDPQDGQVILQEGAGREMCLICHADVEEQMSQAALVHFPLEMDSGCVACHNPHAAAYEHQLNQGPVRTCLSCHEELAAARVNKAHPHRPVFEDSCVICHQPHASERARLLRAEVNDLCLQCHGSQLAGALEAGGAVKLFDGAVEVDPSSLAGVKILPLRPGAQWGHPYPSHPVASGEEITCITCHNPHATARSPKLLVTDTPTATPLCVSCHG